ncbi:MAG: hypothetical protein ACRD2A_11145, partial [Vicinamibacterales bacterium]
MKKRLIGSLATIAIILAVASVPSIAQRGTATPPGSKPIPRAANGKPDLSGVWIAGGIALLFGEEEAAAIRKADAAIGRRVFRQEPPPYKPEAEAKRQEYIARRGVDDPMARCLLSGVPRITVRPLPFEISQLPDRV